MTPTRKGYSELEMLCLLNKLIADGHVVIIDDGTVLGEVSDGTTVQLGYVPAGPPKLNKECRQALYSYLNEHRTPDTW